MSERNPNNPSESQNVQDSSKKSKGSITTPEDKYVEFKKDQIKDAVKKGNAGKAKRHAIEMLQYLNKGDNEMPIEDSLETYE